MMSFINYFLVVLAATTVTAASCRDNFSACNPRGSTSTAIPSIGSGLSSLYTEFLDSINGVKNSKRDVNEARDEIRVLLESRASSSNLCCADGTLCLLLQGLNVPFCYDNYTTNYFLPGGATGQIVSGAFNSSSGQANLVSGDYTLTDGTKGNIYGSENSPNKPNTATLPIPTQYTAAGSGSAIAATALGQVLTITTTFPGTTVEPSTVAPQTIAASVTGTSTVAPATTKPGTTIPGTTIAASMSTYTTTAAAGTSTAKGEAGAATPALGGAAGLGFLLFAIFGL